MLLCWGGIDFPSVSYALRIRQSCLYLESTLSFTRKFCSWILLFLWKNNVTVNVRVFHFLLQFCYMSNVSIVNWFLNANLPFLLRWTYKSIGLYHKRKTANKSIKDFLDFFSNVGYFIRQGWGTPRHQQMEWKDSLAHHHHPSRFSFCYLVYNFRRYLNLPYVQGVGWHLEQHCLAHWSLGKCHSSRLVTFWGRPCHASGWVQYLLKAFRGMAHQVFPDDQVLLSWTTLASQLKCCYDYYSAVYS